MSSERIPGRILGATKLEVSRLGLGLAAIARPGYITLGRDHDLGTERSPEALYARCSELLDAARTAGIRSIDVARSYGRAEEFLARWIRERAVARDELTISSKWGYAYTAGWRVDAPEHEQKDLSAARFRTQLAETRVLIGDWLDLYQIHSATAESGSLENAELLGALVDGRRRGLYAAIGATVSGPTSARAVELAAAARVDGERVFDSVQATFNCLEPSLASVLGAAHESGLGVIVKEAFANGRLTDANQSAADRVALAPLTRLARERGATLDQLALAFVIAQPFVDVVLSGAATTAQLASHVAAFGLTLDGPALELMATVAEPSPHYWATRSALPWS